MKVQRAPLVAATLIFIAGAVMPPGYTQLPPTNMGKWVHQPGDNQYGNQAQTERHAVPMAPQAPSGGGGGGGGSYSSGWSPAPRPNKPDVSLDAIAADEPIPPAGFPPLPEKLDLPVQSSWAAGGGSAWRGAGGGGGSYGGANAPGMSGGGGGGPSSQFQGSHQHYNHYEPGSFGASGSHGYYKATTPPPPGGSGDVYASGGSPGTGGAEPTAAEKALRGLGREPRLNPKNDQQAQPEAPQPVIINQSGTQDLSLPEDDFAYDKRPRANSVGRRLKRSMGRAILRPINSAGSYAGISF